MTEKNIFAYKLFLSLNISDFNLFFYVKIATPLKKGKKSPPFSPFSQSCQAPPLFENLVGGSTPPPCRKGEGCTLCLKQTIFIFSLFTLNIPRPSVDYFSVQISDVDFLILKKKVRFLLRFINFQLYF